MSGNDEASDVGDMAEPDGYTEHGDEVFLVDAHRPLAVRKTYRLRSIQHMNGQEREAGIVLETTARLKDWIIVTYDEMKHSDRQVRAFRRELVSRWGPKVLVLPNDIEFFVFEETDG